MWVHKLAPSGLLACSRSPILPVSRRCLLIRRGETRMRMVQRLRSRMPQPACGTWKWRRRAGLRSIGNSLSYQINLFETESSVTGTAVNVNGDTGHYANLFQPTVPVSFKSGDPIEVKLNYLTHIGGVGTQHRDQRYLFRGPRGRSRGHPGRHLRAYRFHGRRVLQPRFRPSAITPLPPVP